MNGFRGQFGSEPRVISGASLDGSQGYNIVVGSYIRIDTAKRWMLHNGVLLYPHIDLRCQTSGLDR